MAYFLGKEIPSGDLSSVLGGALGSTTAKPTSTTDPKTTASASSKTNANDCYAKCTGQGLAPGTSKHTQCVNMCENEDCLTQCENKGFVAGTVDMSACISACQAGAILPDPNPLIPGKKCSETLPCPTGFKCVNGSCVQDTPGPNDQTCPEGTGATYAGCNCGKYYTTMTGNCVSGYVFVPRTGTGWDGYKQGAKGRCECSKWCQATGYGTDCKGGGGQGGGTSGEYNYPQSFQDLLNLLIGRGNEFLGMKPGYSQAAQNKMFGLGFENLRDQGNATRNTLLNTLQSQGMGGTGAATDIMNQQSWNTEQGISDLARQLFIGNEEKKKKDLLDYSTAAQSLLGTGMNYEQLREAINAARRGEGTTAMALLLQLMDLMNG